MSSGNGDQSLSPAQNALNVALRLTLVFAFLYLFLIGVQSLSGGIKFFGADFAKTLLDVTSNPMIALLAGVLTTVLVQSSSATTSLIVGMVASGSLPLDGAIPMIMGANIGTSITNTLVSMGFARNNEFFQRSFAAATIHDFFNILSVAVLLPLEIMTGFLKTTAVYFSDLVAGSLLGGAAFKSPIKAAIKPVAKMLQTGITDGLGLEGIPAGLILTALGFGLIVFSLMMIVKFMGTLVKDAAAESLNNISQRSPYLTMATGTVLTFLVQSSSITTSLMVPLAGAGVLKLRTILPLTLGANIGTTMTAILAAMAGNPTGLAIAFVHLLFNLAGIAIWYPIKYLREVPIWMAETLAKGVTRNKLYGIAYVAVVFLLIPFSSIWLFT